MTAISEKSQRKYSLSITEAQAQVISNALEFYERIGMGQLMEIFYLRPEASQLEADTRKRDFVERMLDEVKSVAWGLKPSSFYSISSRDIRDDFRVAYDLHQVIRHRLAWDRNPKKDIMNCHKDEPMRWSKVELAKIEEVQ